MNRIYILLLGVAIMGASLLGACRKADYSPLENRAFIAQTSTSGNYAQNVTVGTDPVSTVINVRLSHPAKVVRSFRLVSDENALQTYNKLNSTSYVMLPEEQYTLMLGDQETNVVSIGAGESLSSPLMLTMQPLSAALSSTGAKYAVAFRLEALDGAQLLEAGSTMVFVMDRVVIQPVPVFNFANYPLFTLPLESYNLTDWTIEFNINIDKLGKAVGQYNNQALVNFEMESGHEIYSRFGDAPIEGNRFQCKTQGTQMNSNTLFSENTWYHIAMVVSNGGTKFTFYVNGEEDNTMDLPGKPYVTKNRMSLCATSYFVANAMFSELRFWSVARTQAEIRNNMYACDPSSNGLEVYFKLDEGEGTSFADATGKGGSGMSRNNGAASVTWIQDVRIDGK